MRPVTFRLYRQGIKSFPCFMTMSNESQETYKVHSPVSESLLGKFFIALRLPYLQEKFHDTS